MRPSTEAIPSASPSPPPLTPPSPPAPPACPSLALSRLSRLICIWPSLASVALTQAFWARSR